MGGGTPKTVQRPQKSWVLDPNMGWWDPKMGGGTLRGVWDPKKRGWGPGMRGDGSGGGS